MLYLHGYLREENAEVSDTMIKTPDDSITWDYSVDFLSVGSGGGGMAGALTAKLEGLHSLVIEKSDKIGGTTALSGGVIWIPNNHLMPKANVADSEADGLRYLTQLVDDAVPQEKIASYLHYAPEMLKYLECNSLVQYDPAPVYPDYYSHLPGGKLGARSLDPKPYSINKLGVKFAKQIRRSDWHKRESFSLTASEAHIIFSFDYRAPLIIFKSLLLYWLDLPSRLRKLPDARLTLGRALIGRLRKSLDNEGVELWLNTKIQSLVVDDSGQVIGAKCIKEGSPFNIQVKKAVLMASGGFSHHQALREQYHPHPDVAQWTAASPTDTGDGLFVGQAVGAKWSMMNNVWWSPTMKDVEGNIEAFIVGKSMPNSLIVNKSGSRFLNEAEPYEDFVKDQFLAHKVVDSIPAFFVFDSRYRKEYPLGMMLPPGKYVPDAAVAHLINSGWLKKADSLEALAQLCGIDSAGLVSEVAKLKQFAEKGEDLDFAKGDAPNDVYYSDHRVKPNPCLAFENDGPFYAVNIYPGDLGTKGGLTTNELAQVLNEQDEVIAGLYACGNVSASVMGDSYPGAGSTIGPALTYGYVAAKHAAGTLK
ncbi:MAG: FAD-binding protein [Sinobacterium sp.]|nr:FAD-binding protein [Sinobacterium sp.]